MSRPTKTKPSRLEAGPLKWCLVKKLLYYITGHGGRQWKQVAGRDEVEARREKDEAERLRTREPEHSKFEGAKFAHNRSK